MGGKVGAPARNAGTCWRVGDDGVPDCSAFVTGADDCIYRRGKFRANQKRIGTIRTRHFTVAVSPSHPLRSQGARLNSTPFLVRRSLKKKTTPSCRAASLIQRPVRAPAPQFASFLDPSFQTSSTGATSPLRAPFSPLTTVIPPIPTSKEHGRSGRSGQPCLGPA